MMRLILLAMLVGCALAASVERARRGGPLEEGNRKMPKEKKNPFTDGEDSRERRTANCITAQMWPNAEVCYYFGDFESDKNMRDNIRAAMDVFEDVSCVTFKETENCPSEMTSAKIRNTDPGCVATVGCTSAMNQAYINLATTCDPYGWGVVAHELFHTLGRYHEHTRFDDRDTFVEIHTDNIAPASTANFDKCDRELYDIPYDFESLMHYGRTFFAIDGSKPTLTCREGYEEYNNKIGKQMAFSTLDVVTINKMYNCYADGVDPYDCERGGVKKNTGDCYCIHPFTGTRCEKVVDGAILKTNDGSQTVNVQTPNYPNKYPLNKKMHYVFECTTAGQKAQLIFKDYAIEDYKCGYDTTRTSNSANDLYPTKACGSSLKDKTLTSEDEVISLEFKSDDMYTYKGFDLDFTCV